MGISRFYTCSDGTFCEPLNAFRKVEKKLAREQRKLSRKKEFSRNWKKQKAKVNKVYRKIRDVRLDFLHKHSTVLAGSYGRIYAEDLQVKNMSGSARGTREEPGKNVRAKSGLNKSILDQGWSEFMRQLGYKLSWRGRELVKVPAHHTSQTCSGCSHVSKTNRRSQSRFVCEACGLEMNADHNAALNIKTLGQRGMACEANPAGDRQQEPSGNGDRVSVLA
jgi:putative transposase